MRAGWSHVRALLGSRAFDTSTEAGRSKERYRRVALTTVTSFGARGIASLTALASVPLTLHYLGPERYGLWMAISSAIALLSFGDLGLSNGLMNAVAVSHGKGDRDSANQFVSTAFLLLAGIASVLAAAFLMARRWVDWPGVFTLKSELARVEAGPALLVFAMCYLLGLPLGVIQRVQSGYQRGFANDLWQGLGSILSLLAVLVLIYERQGLPWLVFAMAGGPLLATVLNGVVLFRWSLPWLAPRLRHFEWDAAKKLISNGLMFFVLQIGYVVSFSTDNLIIAHFRGAVAVTPYAVVQRVFLLVAGLQAAWLYPLWPAYGEAIQRGDLGWVRKTLRRSVLLSLGLTGVVALVLLVFSRPLFRAWVGDEAVPSWGLAAGFAFWAVLQAAGNAAAMYLNGTNALKLEVWVSAVFVAVATPVKIWLCSRFGAVGVIWGQVIAYLFLVGVPFTILIPRLLARGAERDEDRSDVLVATAG